MTTVRERAFDLPAYSLAALEWGSGVPVIAMHGWLDNAGTFKRLAPLIEGCRIVAFDAAGHGFSGDRSADSAYNIWQEVGDAYDVAAALGWKQFSIIGHSRGAGVAMLFASAFPDLVSKMVFIDGGLPLIGNAKDAPATLARAVVESRKLRTKSGRVFETRERALRERMNGFTSVNYETAAALAERSLREVDGGWQWRADQRLKAQSEVKLTHEQTLAFVRRVSAPVLAIEAAGGPFVDRDDFQSLWPEFPGLELFRLPGGHHLHLEGAELEIASRATAFLHAQGAAESDARGRSGS